MKKMIFNLNHKENTKEHYIYLSKIKYDVLIFILNFSIDKKYAPTFSEVARKFRFSRARAGAIIAELFKLGFITKGKSAQRKIRIEDYQMEIIENLQFNREYPIKDTIN